MSSEHFLASCISYVGSCSLMNAILTHDSAHSKVSWHCDDEPLFDATGGPVQCCAVLLGNIVCIQVLSPDVNLLVHLKPGHLRDTRIPRGRDALIVSLSLGATRHPTATRSNSMATRWSAHRSIVTGIATSCPAEYLSCSTTTLDSSRLSLETRCTSS